MLGVARGRSDGASSMEAMPLNLSQMMGQKKAPVLFLLPDICHTHNE